MPAAQAKLAEKWTKWSMRQTGPFCLSTSTGKLKLIFTLASKGHSLGASRIEGWIKMTFEDSTSRTFVSLFCIVESQTSSIFLHERRGFTMIGAKTYYCTAFAWPLILSDLQGLCSMARTPSNPLDMNHEQLLCLLTWAPTCAFFGLSFLAFQIHSEKAQVTTSKSLQGWAPGVVGEFLTRLWSHIADLNEKQLTIGRICCDIITSPSTASCVVPDCYPKVQWSCREVPPRKSSQAQVSGNLLDNATQLRASSGILSSSSHWRLRINTLCWKHFLKLGNATPTEAWLWTFQMFVEFEDQLLAIDRIVRSSVITATSCSGSCMASAYMNKSIQNL